MRKFALVTIAALVLSLAGAGIASAMGTPNWFGNTVTMRQVKTATQNAIYNELEQVDGQPRDQMQVICHMHASPPPRPHKGLASGEYRAIKMVCYVREDVTVMKGQ